MAKSACLGMTGLKPVQDGKTVDLSPFTTSKLWDLDGSMTGTPGHLTIPVTGVWTLSGYLTVQPNNPDSLKDGYSLIEIVDQAGQNRAQASNWISSAFSTANVTDTVKLEAGSVLHLTVRNLLGQSGGVVGHFSATLIG